MVGFSLVRTAPLLVALSAALAFGCGGSETESAGGTDGTGGTRGPGGSGGVGSGGAGGDGGTAGTGGSAGDGGTGGTGGAGGTGGSGATGGTGGSGGTGGDSGFCVSNDDCSAGEVCTNKDRCRGLGVCKNRPESCDGVEALSVCGCDGSTYDSKCHAEMAGTGIVYEPSFAPGLPCCNDDFDCEGGAFCHPLRYDDCNPLKICSFGGGVAQCANTIEVCGCDGLTYECPVLLSVSAVGPCTCDKNADCLPTEYCGAADCTGPGNCRPRSDASCNSTLPVAGCDGVIYSNACEAAEAGVRVGKNVQCFPISPVEPKTRCEEQIPFPSTF